MSDAIEQGFVDSTISDNGIATISFGHPLSNSLPGKILQKLADTIEKIGQDATVNVIILQSTGDKAFCAGASFDELISIKDLETGNKFFSGFAKVINACRKCPKFIIGRVHGFCCGACSRKENRFGCYERISNKCHRMEICGLGKTKRPVC